VSIVPIEVAEVAEVAAVVLVSESGLEAKGIVKVRLMAPMALLPLLSLKRCDAASQIRSFSPSSSIQVRGLDMILVK